MLFAGTADAVVSDPAHTVVYAPAAALYECFGDRAELRSEMIFFGTALENLTGIVSRAEWTPPALPSETRVVLGTYILVVAGDEVFVVAVAGFPVKGGDHALVGDTGIGVVEGESMIMGDDTYGGGHDSDEERESESAHHDPDPVFLAEFI